LVGDIFSVVAANLPFVSQRLFLLGPLVQPKKSLWLRLLELLLLYCTIGVLGFLLEKRVGKFLLRVGSFMLSQPRCL